MADTFSNDLRLRLQESGSNAGTWGDLLNGTITNIASGFGQGSEAIPNASTHTITLADGTADEARSLYLKCTGGGQACTVTLGPNTISKVWIIDNATSYTLTFSQGSGANVAIAAGAVKVIATDGAGSGAAVVDTLDGLEGSLSSLAVTGAATMGGLTVDGAVTINNSSPLKLNGTDPLISFQNGAANHWQVGFENTNSDRFVFYENGASAYRMVIDGGNVGIGSFTSSPAAPLDIKLAGTATADIFKFQRSDGAVAGVLNYNGTDGSISLGTTTAHPLAFDTNNAERMRIDSSGDLIKVGGVIKGERGTAAAPPYTFSDDTDTGMFNISNADLGFSVGGSERMRIDSSGNLLVGTTTSPQYAGMAVGSTSLGKNINVFSSSNGSNGIIAVYSSNNTQQGQIYAGTGDMNMFGASVVKIIASSGGVKLTSGATSWVSNSDERAKDIIEPIANATQKVSNLRAVIGKYKTDTEETRRSFLIAQDVQAVLPEAVDATDEDNLGVRYTETIPLLVAAIQEQQATIESQASAITDLTTRLTALENN